MTQQNQAGGGQQGERVEGSLTDGGSLPGKGREDRSFGAGREDETGYGQETGPLATGDTGGASGSSGSTGASKAGDTGGDAHLGSAGTGGTAAGDQQTGADNNQGMGSGRSEPR
ncbi:hypothetical protein [Phenylobacterium sp.]|uniref:hypothetical protein n=1 Tax=Phenylobacterium sp. TaxID=1871053 RepID=UPI002C985945|nr:hypothetical protein [Phenylobacterium sp.]HVI34022.1 hypothetical protein [Phenylobacterium sp.]